MIRLLRRGAVFHERYHPIAWAVIAGLLWIAFGPRLIEHAVPASWHLDQVYGWVFQAATVATGFLFTFYTFVVTTEQGFIAALRGTVTLRRGVAYTVEALIVGVVLCLFCLPFMVTQPLPVSRDAVFYAQAAWVGLSFYGAATLVRATSVFIAIARNHDALRGSRP